MESGAKVLCIFGKILPQLFLDVVLLTMITLAEKSIHMRANLSAFISMTCL